MVQKVKRKGIFTGSTIKNRGWKATRIITPVEGALTTCNNLALEWATDKVHVNGEEMLSTIEYSLGKKKRWLLSTFVEEMHNDISDLKDRQILIREGLMLPTRSIPGYGIKFFNTEKPELNKKTRLYPGEKKRQHHKSPGILNNRSLKDMLLKHAASVNTPTIPQHAPFRKLKRKNRKHRDDVSPEKDIVKKPEIMSIDISHPVPKNKYLYYSDAQQIHYDRTEKMVTRYGKDARNFEVKRRRKRTENMNHMINEYFEESPASETYYTTEYSEVDCPESYCSGSYSLSLDQCIKPIRSKDKNKKKLRRSKQQFCQIDDVHEQKNKRLYWIDQELSSSNEQEVSEDTVEHIFDSPVETKSDVIDMTCTPLKWFQIQIPYMDTCSERLREQFGSDVYFEGNSIPRRFMLDMSKSLCLPLPSILMIFQISENTTELSCEHHDCKTMKIGVVDEDHCANGGRYWCNAHVAVNKLSDSTTNDSLADSHYTLLEDFFVQKQWKLTQLHSSLIEFYSQQCSNLISMEATRFEAVCCSLVLAKNSHMTPGYRPVNNDDSVVATHVYTSHPEWRTQSQEPSNSLTAINTVNKLSLNDTIVPCGICFDDAAKSTSMSQCGDVFCNDCWRNYLLVAIRTAQPDLRCPQVKCKSHVDIVTILSLVTLDVYRTRLGLLENEELTRTGSSKILCPHVNCGRLICLQKEIDVSAVKRGLAIFCKCGTAICIACRSEAHWPASCSTTKAYNSTQRQLGDNKLIPQLTKYAAPLHVEGKKCPSCRRFIEKNGGCPHMSCICSYQFCWKCLGAYTGYPDHPENCSESSEIEEFDFKQIELPEPSSSRSTTYIRALEIQLLRHDLMISKIAYKFAQLNSIAFDHRLSRSSDGSDMLSFYMHSNFKVALNSQELQQYKELMATIQFLYVLSTKLCGKNLTAKMFIITMAKKLFFLAHRIKSELLCTFNDSINSHQMKLTPKDARMRILRFKGFLEEARVNIENLTLHVFHPDDTV